MLNWVNNAILWQFLHFFIINISQSEEAQIKLTCGNYP